MPEVFIKLDQLRTRLLQFFKDNETDARDFGNTVNQVFEAFVFASTAAWYGERGWDTEFVHPDGTVGGGKAIHLKYTARAKPSGYSYVRCLKNGNEIHIRHQLRVATRSHEEGDFPLANVNLDVAVVQSQNLSHFKWNDHVSNATLISFGEAKHLAAFAELVASFIGLVYEMQPDRLHNLRNGAEPRAKKEHLAPFLYVSGGIQPSAEGIIRTIQQRGFDLDVYNSAKALTDAIACPMQPKTKRKRDKAVKAKGAAAT